ncbi:unnamed protein product [Mesocestoides corti]|uniref:CCDC113/CCDC96 coiled-coil domain-containing protein n=1 Tax=Mesocestoides corti TaxID=53468 RepID=A0A3P6GR84_MESCO|nr:unnamed protein product [Mesocestoides corti]
MTPETSNEADQEPYKQELLEQHRTLLERRRKAANMNIQLQTRLAEYFRRKRADAVDAAHSNVDSLASSVVDTGADYNARFSKYITTLSEMQDRFMNQKKLILQEISNLKRLCDEKSDEAERTFAGMADFIENQGKEAISYKSGRPLPIEYYKAQREMLLKKNSAVTKVRLENIKLQRQVEKINAAFKSHDLSEGLHLIDFEQMKIENQTYNEKIEERNEETGKLRRKITNTVQMMTHTNEKLQACQAENFLLRDQLNLWTRKLNDSRDTLTKLKQSRDALKNNYALLQRTSGLMSHLEMLRGYEETVDEVETKKREIASMKQQAHSFLAKAKFYEDKVCGTKRKLETTKARNIFP